MNRPSAPVAELICVGTEHLLGEVVDTNSPYLCGRLKELGICVYRKQVCGDHAGRLREALTLALSRADLVILIGGLGPTEDDLSRECVAETLGLPLWEDPELVARLREYFASRARRMASCNLRQARRPQGSVVLENACGTAPGLWIEWENKPVVLLPGPPKEFCMMVDRELMPRLSARYQSVPIVTRSLRLYGIGESELAERLSAFWDGIGEVTVADYIKDGEIELRLACRMEETQAKKKISDAIRLLAPHLRPYLYATQNTDLAHALIERFAARGLRFSSAESCTGGAIASLLAAVPGASEVLWGACVTYDNEAKTSLVCVSEETLRTHGAVSDQTAREMARGMAERSKSDLALSVTGLAGPGDDGVHPVGTVFFGVSFRGEIRVFERHFSGDRARIRRDAALYGIALSLQTAGLFEALPEDGDPAGDPE